MRLCALFIIFVGLTLGFSDLTAQTSLYVISRENAEQLTLIQQFGTGEIRDIAWFSDGTRFAVATRAGVAIYSADDLSLPLQFLDGGRDGVWTVHISADDRYLTYVRVDGRVSVWEVDSENVPINIPIEEALLSVVTSEGVVIVGRYADISIYDDFTATQPTARYEFEIPSILSAMRLSTDERYIRFTGCEEYIYSEPGYSVCREWHTEVWDWAEGVSVPESQFSTNAPQNVLIIEETTILVATGDDREALLGIEGDTPILSARLSPDYSLLAFARSEGLYLWDIESNNEIASNIGHSGLIVDVLFSPDDRLLASASWDRTARLWDMATGELLFTVEGDDWFGPVAFNASGTIWLVSVDATLTAWDIDPESETFETMLTEVREISAITQIGQSADYETIATGTMVGTVMVRSVELDNVLATFATSQDMIPAIDMNADATLVAYWQSNQMQLRDIANDVAMTSIAFDTVAQQARFSPTQPIVALATDCLHLWYYETGELIGIEGVENLATVAFSPDGALLVAGDNTGAIHVIDVATRELLMSLHRQYNVRSVAFSHDGTMIASAGEDGSVMVWAVD